MSAEEQKEENEHYLDICKTFESYEFYHSIIVQRHLRHYYKLTAKDQDLLVRYSERIEQMKFCVSQNQKIFDLIIADVNKEMLRNRRIDEPEHSMESLRSMLRQVARDWSREGADERSIYDKIVGDCENMLPRNAKVVVPGAGLGRLAFELAKAGFRTQGCDFSLLQLLMSQIILNGNTSFTIYPYLFPFSNSPSASFQLRAVQIPDCNICLPDDTEFNMLAGDFLQVYAKKEEICDAVVTCFFIDTAQNVVDYVRLIWKLLRKGAIWINAGPLQWHWENSSKDTMSIELNMEELLDLIKRLGFEFVVMEEFESSYAQDIRSMHLTSYLCKYFVARKK